MSLSLSIQHDLIFVYNYIMRIWNELTYINKSSIALGFFDGLHLGHRLVLKNAINIAKENNVESTVITFKTHPLNSLTGEKIDQILSLDEKINLMEKIGIDNLVLLNFDDVASIRANDYLENILIKYFSPIAITTGFNHHFGFNKEGNSELLRNNKDKYNYKYFEIPPFVVKNNIVSCSNIRDLLHLGDFPNANELLGYKFFIDGIVIKGEQFARKLGYPSANIVYPDEKIKIPHGVYFVEVTILNKKYNGILNYGFAPTVNNSTIEKTEVHILDFNQNIYGEKIRIEFITKIRNQMKFDNIEKLKAQINRDIAFVEIYKYFLKGHFEFSLRHF